MNKNDKKWIEQELDSDSPDDQALEWVSRLATGDTDAAALAQFEQWRNSDPRNEEALVEARSLWLLLGRPLEARYAPPLASLPPPQLGFMAKVRQRPFLPLTAALLLALGLGWQWASVWRYDQTTGTGEQRTVVLRDGSTMWLNTDSAADVHMERGRRYVRLARGEAYFDVVHDTAHPFVVDAGPGRITVLGTAFGVHREGEDVVVTVRRGRVQVAGGGSPSVVVTPDQAVRVHPGDKAKIVEVANAERVLSWRTGRLLFENRPVGEVLNELRRYDRRMIIVSYPDADRRRVSAIVDLARINEWYDTLEQSLPVDVVRIGPVVWIRPSAQVQRTAVRRITQGPVVRRG